ncbi:EamA family transporter [Aldersonia kunmingensis]|uniref:EamA family transporter n=1 Tax=Aldersonia kunmingensis TaxID=408066 RepID=UPI0009FF6067|nr:EamA family transporter [Aldersonia kunmingensis]
MTTRDRNLALLVVLLWGVNFLAIRAALDVFPPFFLGALRFLLIAIPVVIFIPRPQVQWRWLLVYGLGFGVAQFAFLFAAMQAGMPTGLASLVLQSSAPFTVVLGTLFLGERIGGLQIGGLLLALAGMVTIGWDQAEHATLLPVILTLLGGLGWAFGNIGSRLAQAPNPLHFMLWMSVIPPIPMLALSLTFEGPSAGLDGLTAVLGGHAWPALIGIAYIVLLGTIAGSGLWTGLLTRYPAASVAPFSLLVPIVGIGASWLVLHEQPSAATIVGGVVVIAGAAAATGALRIRRRAAEIAAVPTGTDSNSNPVPVPARQ